MPPQANYRLYRLGADLNAVAVRIEYDALVVAITGTSWAIHNRESVVAQTLGELVDKSFRTHRYGQMRKSQPLRSRGQFRQRQRDGRQLADDVLFRHVLRRGQLLLVFELQ